MLTSHVFKDIVAQSSKLMNKFVMKVSPKRKWDFVSLTMFERVHQNVKLMEFKSEDESIATAVEGLYNIGGNVKRVELNDCGVSMDVLVKVFQAMPRLTIVDLVGVKVTGNVSDVALPEFRNLRTLKIANCDSLCEIFQRASSISKISFESNDRKSLELTKFEDVLHNQKYLETLELVNIKFSNFLEGETNFPFQLKSLKIHQCHFKKRENLENFLEAQQSLIEVDLTISNMKLQLDRARYFEESLKIIMQQKHLKQLSLDIENYEFANTNFLQKNVNRNVQHLILKLEKTSCSLSTIFSAFPNVKSLAVSTKDVDLENIKYINENLLNLQSIKVTKFPSELFGKLKVRNLKSLHVNETNIEINHWMEFLDNNPTMTKLIIVFTFFVDLSEEFIDRVTKKLNLEHLELIDKWIGMQNEIYKMICNNSKNLKYLKLHNINVEKNFDESDKEYLRSRNIKFHLYNDESLNAPMVPF